MRSHAPEPQQDHGTSAKKLPSEHSPAPPHARNNEPDDVTALLVHDLRNPLSGLIGLLQVLGRDLRGSEQGEDVELALQAAQQIKDITDDLLDVRQLQEGKGPVAREPNSLRAIVNAAVRNVAALANERQLQIEQEGDDTAVVVDTRLLRRALENLFGLATRYAPHGSVVRVLMRIEDDIVSIQVADAGAPVPEPLQATFFDRRGSSKAEQGAERRGVGCGLYLVQLVARLHGGRAWAENGPDGGSLLCLSLKKNPNGTRR